MINATFIAGAYAAAGILAPTDPNPPRASLSS